jgi:hypothetical protein
VLGQSYRWRFEYSEQDHVWEAATLAPVDWGRVACEYDWLLVSKPYDGQFIRLNTTLKTENDSAALFAVDRRDCRPTSSTTPVRLQTEH